jgi:hypothetical protein
MLQINNGSVEVDASIMGTQQDGKKVKVPLNSSDKLYKEIRDLNFEVVVQVLRQRATSIQQDYAEVKSTNTQSVSELKDFVRRLHSLPEIAACSFGATLAILHRKTLIPCPTRHRTNNIGGSEL